MVSKQGSNEFIIKLNKLKTTQVMPVSARSFERFLLESNIFKVKILYVKKKINKNYLA